MQFSLQALYEQFIKTTNWWTRSNCNLPLIRYLGAKFKLYRAENYDYVVTIERCLPLQATDLMYISCHPAVMMMTKRAIFVPCRKNSFFKKPYKTVRVRPPSQMKTGWHFQKDLANFPLVVIRAVACSFDRIYTSSSASSATIGFTSLNLQSFQLHNWNTPPTSGYQPQPTQWLLGIPKLTSTTTDPTSYKVGDLTYLGNTTKKQLGTPINATVTSDYFSKPDYWGNIFCPEYLKGTNPVFVTNKDPKTWMESEKDKLIKNSHNVTLKTTSNLIQCRYNPFNDKGVGNAIYLISNRDNQHWEQPEDPKLMRINLPLWLLPFGWLDWQKKAKIVSSVDVSYMTVIQCPTIDPPNQKHIYLPLDETFLSGTSPYTTQLFDNDSKFWYPKNRFQADSLNTIGTCGPGIIKLPKTQSCEAHMQYYFHFKFGGCPPPMEQICNPETEPKYPIPDTKHETTSLQSPTTPIQTYLYSFDERRGIITNTAAKRIKKDSETETTSLALAGPATDLQPSYKILQESTESSSEEEEEDIHLQLRHLRRKQKLLRRRILQLLDTQNLE